MKLLSLFVLFVVSALGVLEASANGEGSQCYVGRAWVLNSAEDQTEDVRGGIVYDLGGNNFFGPLGDAVEVLAGNEAEVVTPETLLPAGAIPIEVYLGGAIYTGTLTSVITPCASAPSAKAGQSFSDGRLNPNGADTAVVYQNGTEYAVWGVDPGGNGFEAFTFTCAGLQEILNGAQAEANGNYLLNSSAAPGRSGDVQLWAVPGSGGSLGLVLVSPGQGGDTSKQTIVPLAGVCPDLAA